jgi:hypothetical protein
MAMHSYICRVLVALLVVLMGYATVLGQASAQPTTAPSPRPLNATPPPKKVPGVQLKATPKATATPKASDESISSTYTSKVLSNGSTAFTVKANQFVITLPKGWEALDLDSETLSAALDTVTQDNPEFGSVLTGQMQQLVAQGIKFYAVDLSGKPVRGELPTTMNVLIQKLPGKLPMKSLVNLTAQQLETIFSLNDPVEQAVLKMPVGEVGFLRYAIPLKMPTGKTVNVTATQYLVQGKAGLYIVSFSGSPSAAKTKAKAFEAAMKTFAFLK